MIRSEGMNTGFTLAELAAVILITGLILGSAAMIAAPILRKARTLETQAKLGNIARAIDFYAAQNFRVPCPASPDRSAKSPPLGYEAGSGEKGTIVPADCGTDPKQWEGVVPFKTLSIPVDWITDSSNQYITYAISPAFAQDVSKDIPVHSRCRTADWFLPEEVYRKDITDPLTGKSPSNVALPKSERKARFCCSGAQLGTDLVIIDANGQPQIAVPRQTSAASYRTANMIFPDLYAPNVPVPDKDRVTAPVYVLVSHGKNGFGVLSGVGRTRFPVEGATPAEKENANGDRTFVEILPADRAGKEIGFDDSVLWRTQDMIFAEQGKSCALP